MNFEDYPILRPLEPSFMKKVRLSLVFGGCGNEALLLTCDDHVYAIGLNSSGCLGLGDKKGRSTLTAVSALSGKNIKDFAYGGNYMSLDTISELFVVARCADGSVYYWGDIPNTSPQNCVLKPYLVNNLNYKVVEVSCGIAHCMALCNNGQVYTWGDNSNNQLGRVLESDEDLNVEYLTADRVEDLDGQFVVQISCGAYFSVAVIDDGKLMSWGSNDYGQIGVEDSDTRISYPPTKVFLPEDVAIKKVACGYAHVLALTESGSLYTWGKYYKTSSSGYLTTKAGLLPLKTTRLCGQPVSKFTDIDTHYALNISIVRNEKLGVLVCGNVSEKLRATRFQSVQKALIQCSIPVMIKPLHLVKRGQSIAEALEDAIEHQVNSDLSVVVEDQKICVHRSILSIRSEYFRTMLAQLDTHENVITIKGKKYEVMKAYLRYIYTDRLPVNLDLVVDLLILANKYGDDDLRGYCEKHIQDNMSLDLVVKVVEIKNKIPYSESLSEFCSEFAARHPEINSREFEDMDAAALRIFFAKCMRVDE